MHIHEVREVAPVPDSTEFAMAEKTSSEIATIIHKDRKVISRLYRR